MTLKYGWNFQNLVKNNNKEWAEPESQNNITDN